MRVATWSDEMTRVWTRILHLPLLQIELAKVVKENVDFVIVYRRTL